MDWFRSHHGAPSDPKWLVIARKAKVAPVVVVSTFWMLLDYASQHEERGSVAGFDIEVTAAFLGVEDEEVQAVLTAMEDKGVITDGRLSNWDKRQPKRERDDDSSERVKRHREAQKTTANHVTPCNATVTPSNAQIDREKEREREQTEPPTPTEATAQDPFDPTKGAPMKPRSSSFDLDEVLADAPNWEAELNALIAQKGSIANPRGYKAAIVRGWLQHPDDASTPPKKKPTPPLPPPPPPVPREVLSALGWDEETCRLYMSQAIGQLKQQGAFEKYDPAQHRAMAIEQARALRACVRGTTGTGQGNGHGQGGRMYQ